MQHNLEKEQSSRHSREKAGWGRTGVGDGSERRGGMGEVEVGGCGGWEEVGVGGGGGRSDA